MKNLYLFALISFIVPFSMQAEDRKKINEFYEVRDLHLVRVTQITTNITPDTEKVIELRTNGPIIPKNVSFKAAINAAEHGIATDEVGLIKRSFKFGFPIITKSTYTANFIKFSKKTNSFIVEQGEIVKVDNSFTNTIIIIFSILIIGYIFI